MIIEINKLNDGIKLGRIIQETANKTVASLIDDPQYNQVKLKNRLMKETMKFYYATKVGSMILNIIKG